MSEQLALLPSYLTAHLQLALFALLAGVSISVPLGVLVHRLPKLEQPLLGLASVVQTIPSLALLAAMVPLLAAAQLPSIGYLPAFIGLVLYSMLPILRNTIIGLAGIDPAVLEAARGVGMAPRQQLFRVELPLALPVIVAGIRTSAVWTVGAATLSTPIGAQSLGNYIFGGLQTRNLDALLVGCVAAAALALLLDALVRQIALGIERRGRLRLLAGAVALGLLYGYAGVTLGQQRGAQARSRVVIGAKTFTEQYILSEILAGQLERSAGLVPELKQSLGSSVAFDALGSGGIDVYVDYSGTIWATVMHRQAEPGARSRVLAEVKRYLSSQHGITLVGPLGFENAYALAMRRKQAEQLHVRRLSDLARHASALSIGGDYEFFGRAEWRTLERVYGLRFAQQRSMDPSLMYQAAAQGTVDVISAFSTDGRIAALDLVVIEDDRGAIPPYDAIILAGKQLSERHPKAIAALQDLVGKIDAQSMRRMNRAVDEEGKSPAAVARTFLEAR